MNTALFAGLALMGAVAYRFRGGGYISTGHTWIARIIWGIAVLIAYLFTHPHDIMWPFVAMLIPLVYVSMLVPHAFCQNMGRWPTPQKKWPAFFQFTITDAEWTAWPFWHRNKYDFESMVGVGFFRGLAVFAPLLACVYFSGLFVDLIGFWWAMVTLMLGQAIAYTVGWFIPFSIPSCAAKSNEWGEFLTGAVWVLAIAQL